VLLVAVGLGAVAGCSSSSDSVSIVPPSTATTGRPLPGGVVATPDPCRLVSPGDIARIVHLAAPVTAQPTTRTGSGAYKECAFAGSDGDAWIAITASDQGQFDATRKSRTGGDGCTGVPGVGQSAYYCGPHPERIAVLADNHEVDFEVHSGAAGNAGADAAALARYVLTRL
jgi:hypothetical protein